MQPLTGGAAQGLVGAAAAWSVVLAAADLAGALATAGRAATFSVGDDLQLTPAAPDDPTAIMEWQPGHGWSLLLPRRAGSVRLPERLRRDLGAAGRQVGLAADDPEEGDRQDGSEEAGPKVDLAAGARG